MSEWFNVNVDIRQGCVISPWLFNVYMDDIIKDVNARVQERGLRLEDQGGNDWRVTQILYANETVLLGDIKENLH